MTIPFDLLIRNGMLIDGTGASGYRADIAVHAGRIAEIGVIPPEASAKQTVDATNQVISPGFIDIHTHADIAMLARPDHLPKIMQGVTTEVFTNCGLGFAPVTDAGLSIQRQYIAGLFGDDTGVEWDWHTVAEFLAKFERQGIAANIAYLIPHGAVRVSAMGMEERPATAEERDRMLALVEDGMDQGAWGLSTGIWYAPMRSADREELVALCRAAGFFATHQRDYAEGLFAATVESLQIAHEAKVPVQIAHLQMNGPDNRGRAPELLTLLDDARAGGIDVTCDTYPYTAGSTFVQSLLPPWAVNGGPEAILRRLSDPTQRAHVVDSLRHVTDWDSFSLVGSTSATNAPYEGKNFVDIAQARGMDVAEWVCCVIEEEQLRACFVRQGAHEGNVRDILQWPHQMIGSDGLHLPGKTHPRLYGTFPRILGRYVREERIVSLETAIHKMTGAPAARLGLSRRGTLAVGNAADIVVLNSETIQDVATFDDPFRFPEGIDYVFINGCAVKWNGAATSALPGQVLRKR